MGLSPALSRARLTWGLACVCVLPLCGCGHVGALVKAREIQRASSTDRLRFLDRVGYAYNLLGLEYYTLAKEAEDSGNDRKSQEYAAKARMYNLFYKEMKGSADELRHSLRGVTPSPALAAGADAGPAPPPPPEPQARAGAAAPVYGR